MKKLYIILGVCVLSIVGIGIGLLQGYKTLPLSSESLEELHAFNETFGMDVLSLEDVRGVDTSSFSASVLGIGDSVKPKGLIVDIANDPDTFYLLQPKQQITDEHLKTLVDVYKTIPEFTHVEIDQDLVLSSESDGEEEVRSDSIIRQSLTQEQKAVSEVRVGVFDSGIDVHHTAFQETNVAIGWDGVLNKFYRTGDDIGHGTHIAGIIAKYAPNATVVPYRIITKDGGRLSHLLLALQFAKKEGHLNVINMSFGFNENSEILEKLMETFKEDGVVVVAAAGNNKNDTPFYPAYYDSVLAVGAVTAASRTVSSSNFGPWVDVASLGYYVRSALPQGKYGYKSGTSQAAARVTAVIANELGNNQSSVLNVALSNFTPVMHGALKGLPLVR